MGLSFVFISRRSRLRPRHRATSGHLARSEDIMHLHFRRIAVPKSGLCRRPSIRNGGGDSAVRVSLRYRDDGRIRDIHLAQVSCDPQGQISRMHFRHFWLTLFFRLEINSCILYLMWKKTIIKLSYLFFVMNLFK